MRRQKLCFVAATPMTLRAFMMRHLAALAERYDVTAISSFQVSDLEASWPEGVRLVAVPIARQISPLEDVRALVSLWRTFRREGFDAVHSITPKAGLLAMSAARLAGVPYRVHCFTGQVWATRRGASRLLLKSADRVIAALATDILVDSRSQRDFLVREGVLRHDQGEVLGKGSISGVDPHRFRPNPKTRQDVRAELNIPDDACVVLFVGRLSREKGVLDLAQAFASLARRRKDVWLLVVGPDEANVSSDLNVICGGVRSRLRRIDFTAQPERYMAASDVFALPSYREGFGSVAIEAAACGLPAVASRIYGLTDAIEDGVTGLLHEPRDVPGLEGTLDVLCGDRDLRLKMGSSGLVRARSDFDAVHIVEGLVQFYRRILSARFSKGA